MILVEGRRTTLLDFPGYGKARVVDTVAGIHLKSGLVGRNIQAVCGLLIKREHFLFTQEDSPDTRVDTPEGKHGAI